MYVQLKKNVFLHAYIYIGREYNILIESYMYVCICVFKTIKINQYCGYISGKLKVTIKIAFKYGIQFISHKITFKFK